MSIPFTARRVCDTVSPASIETCHADRNPGFSEKSTYEDLRNAPCTSCAVLEDMSVYWAPTLYFRHADGRYEEVGQEGGMLAYVT